MKFQLSAEAWIALGCLVGVVFFSLVILWGVWRRGMLSRRSTPPAEKGEIPSFDGTWKKEDALFAELARKTEDLRERPQEDPEDTKS
jgi:hypothetical protein